MKGWFLMLATSFDYGETERRVMAWVLANTAPGSPLCEGVRDFARGIYRFGDQLSETMESFFRLSGAMESVWEAYAEHCAALNRPRREGAPWWERLAMVGVEGVNMTAVKSVRAQAHKMRGRKNRSLRGRVRRAARRMDRIVTDGGALVKVYSDGTILGFPAEGVSKPVRFRGG